MEITYLMSQRKSHLRNHYELRITEAFGKKWWIVFDEGRHKPEYVGDDSKLPKYARDQLTHLRKEPEVRDRRKARYIKADLAFFPGEESGGIPHYENVDWLKQYRRISDQGHYEGFYSTEKGYLVVLDSGNEDYPMQIWESRGHASGKLSIDLLNSEFILVWKRPKEADE